MSSVAGPTAHLEASQTATVRDPRPTLRHVGPSVATVLLGLLLLATLTYLYVDAFWGGTGPVDAALVAIAALLALVGFTMTLATSLPAKAPRRGDIVVATAGTAFALLLTRNMEMPLLVAVGVIGLALGVASLPGGPLDAAAAGCGFTGMFTGLVGPSVNLPWHWVMIAGVVSGVLFSVIGPAVLSGVGARMGTVAFLAGSGVYLLARVAGEHPSPVIPPPIGALTHWSVLPIAMAGALVTWALTWRTPVPFVMAAGAGALLVCGAMAVALPELSDVLGSAWVGGSLIGSATPARLPTALWIGLAGIIYGALMLHFEGPLTGHIGVLGATATVACLAVAGIEWLIHAPGIRVPVGRITSAR